MQPLLSSFGSKILQCFSTRHFIHILGSLTHEEREKSGIKEPCSLQYLIGWKKPSQGENCHFLYLYASALFPETVTVVLRDSVQRNHYVFSSNVISFISKTWLMSILKQDRLHKYLTTGHFNWQTSALQWKRQEFHFYQLQLTISPNVDKQLSTTWWILVKTTLLATFSATREAWLLITEKKWIGKY